MSNALQQKKRTRVKDMGPYLVNEKWIGVYNDHTVGVIIDNTIDKQSRKKQVKIMRTENVNLLAGLDTVAVFNIKRPVVIKDHEVPAFIPPQFDSEILTPAAPEPQPEEKLAPVLPINKTYLFINHFNKIDNMKKSNRLFRDPGVPGATETVVTPVNGDDQETTNAGSGEVVEESASQEGAAD